MPEAASWSSVGRDYARAWRSSFAPRVRLAATCAHLAMRPRRRGIVAARPATLARLAHPWRARRGQGAPGRGRRADCFYRNNQCACIAHRTQPWSPRMNTEDASTFDVLREVIAKDHGLAPDTLHPDTPLAELTIDSLALIELIFTLEDRFNVAADNVPADLPTLGSVADVHRWPAHGRRCGWHRGRARSRRADACRRTTRRTPRPTRGGDRHRHHVAARQRRGGIFRRAARGTLRHSTRSKRRLPPACRAASRRRSTSMRPRISRRPSCACWTVSASSRCWPQHRRWRVPALQLDDGRQRSRAGVFVGTGMGGGHTTDDGYHALYADGASRPAKPFTVLMAMQNAAAAWIGIDHGFGGPNLTFSTACSSSAVAIGEAWRRIRDGEVDVALAGGSEAPLTFRHAQGVGSAAHPGQRGSATMPRHRASRSRRDRSGMVLGEGAAMLVLEDWEHARRRGARISRRTARLRPVHRQRPHHPAHGRRPGARDATRARVRRPVRRRDRPHQRARHRDRRPTMPPRPPRSSRCSANARYGIPDQRDEVHARPSAGRRRRGGTGGHPAGAGTRRVAAHHQPRCSRIRNATSTTSARARAASPASRWR